MPSQLGTTSSARDSGVDFVLLDLTNAIDAGHARQKEATPVLPLPSAAKPDYVVRRIECWNKGYISEELLDVSTSLPLGPQAAFRRKLLLVLALQLFAVWVAVGLGTFYPPVRDRVLPAFAEHGPALVGVAAAVTFALLGVLYYQCRRRYINLLILMWFSAAQAATFVGLGVTFDTHIGFFNCGATFTWVLLMVLLVGVRVNGLIPGRHLMSPLVAGALAFAVVVCASCALFMVFGTRFVTSQAFGYSLVFQFILLGWFTWDATCMFEVVAVDEFAYGVIYIYTDIVLSFLFSVAVAGVAIGFTSLMVLMLASGGDGPDPSCCSGFDFNCCIVCVDGVGGRMTRSRAAAMSSSLENESEELAPLEPMIARSLDSEPDIGQLINDFPQDGTDEAFDRFLRTHHSKKLRAACTQLGLHPQADPSTNHKDGYIELLIQYRRARLRGEVFSGNFRTKAKQKKKMGTFDVEGRTKHCGFRLANVLFSPTFFRRMVESGALPSTGVEVEPVDGRTKFWREVAVAYASENPQFDVVVGQIARYEGIDPRLAPHHSSAKLCAMWKDLTTRYEESLARWKQLGTDTVGLAHFCGDYLDGLYLHDWLQLRPIAVDPEQARASKRARTGNTIQQANENSSVGGDSTQEQAQVDRRNFLTPNEVNVATQSQTSTLEASQHGNRFIVSSSAVQASGQRQVLSARRSQEPRHILPRTDAFPVHQVGPPAEEQQVPAQRQSPRTLEERLLHVLDANSERRQVNKYDGVIYSSQAVRDTMSAIEALKRGGFDRTVIAQAEECMDAIVQVWLRELDNAGKRGADS